MSARWQDEQLISEAYIRKATSKQIDNSLTGNTGYGYQIRIEDNGFSFRGMGSQLAYAYPDQDFIFACISDTQGSSRGEESILRAFHEEIFSKMTDAPLPEDSKMKVQLKENLDALIILPQQGELTSKVAQDINRKWYRINPNPMGITQMRFILQILPAFKPNCTPISVSPR